MTQRLPDDLKTALELDLDVRGSLFTLLRRWEMLEKEQTVLLEAFWELYKAVVARDKSVRLNYTISRDRKEVEVIRQVVDGSTYDTGFTQTAIYVTYTCGECGGRIYLVGEAVEGQKNRVRCQTCGESYDLEITAEHVPPPMPEPEPEED